MDLKNQVVVITGASSGIGKACALKFLTEGCYVVMASRSQKNLEKAVIDIDSHYKGKVLLKQADVTQLHALEELAQETIRKFGRIDIWINNAGVGIDTNIEDGDITEIDKVININIKGVINGTRVAVTHMKSNTGKIHGEIINVSSLASQFAFPGMTIYCATKAAVSKFSEGMAVELKYLKIKLLNVLPGVTDTNFYPDSLGNEGFLKTKCQGTLMQYTKKVDASVVAAKIVKHAKKGKTNVNIVVTKLDRAMMLAFKLFKRAINLYATYYWNHHFVSKKSRLKVIDSSSTKYRGLHTEALDS